MLTKNGEEGILYTVVIIYIGMALIKNHEKIPQKAETRCVASR